MAYAVSQRTRELGIRLALGASTRDVRSMVFRQGIVLTAAGIAIGIAVAIAASRLATTLLYNTSPFDLVTFTVVPAVLVAVACVAIYVPARRASRVDPVIALRSS
jgi:ABC-type antimicrobial peptide transport system permease subunit